MMQFVAIKGRALDDGRDMGVTIQKVRHPAVDADEEWQIGPGEPDVLVSGRGFGSWWAKALTPNGKAWVDLFKM